MLQYKINQILLAMGKKNPAVWLVKNCGFSKAKAYNIINNKQSMISLKDFSKLCDALYCTPNDLMYWQNTPAHQLQPQHPCITKLTPPEAINDWHKLLNHLTPTDIEEVRQLALAKMEKENNLRRNPPTTET